MANKAKYRAVVKFKNGSGHRYEYVTYPAKLVDWCVSKHYPFVQAIFFYYRSDGSPALYWNELKGLNVWKSK